VGGKKNWVTDYPPPLGLSKWTLIFLAKKFCI
jgi:hypothetical protein